MSTQQKGYFIADYSRFKISSMGVYRKITDQLEAFRQEGFYIEMIDNFPKPRTELKKMLATLPFTPIGSDWKMRVPDGADFLFIRYFFSDAYFIRFLKKYKKKNPSCKIIVEFHDYPYDRGLWNPKQFMFLVKDKLHRGALKKYVDRIACLCDEPEIFGVPTLRFTNGINVSAVSPREPVNQTDDTIHLIAVAHYGSWHAYDRVLTGIGEYYKNGGQRNVMFHIVGKGKPIKKYPQYQDVIAKYQIESHVKMHGVLYGESLDNVYNFCRVGVDALGWHRMGVSIASTLKSREYLAKGLPFIHATPVDGFLDGKCPYLCKQSEDERPVDIEQIIQFYDTIYQNPQKTESQVIEEIREIAFQKVDSRANMQEIFRYIRAEK